MKPSPLYTPVLVSVDDIQPAVYNPREADALRLEYLTTSISYLGFVLPLYATPEGHLLSGHQRLSVAKSLGCKRVPVVYVDVEEKWWKQVNLLFNRVTNDMDVTENSELLVNQLEDISIEDAISGLKPKTPDTPEFFPCMEPDYLPGDELTAEGIRQYSSHAVGQCHSMLRYKIMMPALRSRDSGKIVNGSYRVYAGLERTVVAKEDHTYPVVHLSEEEAHLAEALVNLISMKFTVEKQMSDLLRYGGYRRPENKVEDLIVAMRYWADGKKAKSAIQSLSNPRKFWHGFRQAHGNTVADMGAGQRRNGLILRQKGIKCVDWEPYPCDWQGVTGDKADRPSLTLSRIIANEFLDEIEAGTRFDSIFANAVINSIPFHQDRMAFLCLCHAISSFHTGFYGTCKNIEGMRFKEMLPINRIDENGNVSEARQQAKFQLPYEEGVVLADISKAPKVQKHHSRAELTAMLKTFYGSCTISGGSGLYMFFEAHHPKRVSPKALRHAIQIEFNMPFPEGRMDLVDRAVDVFSKRHGVDLSLPEYAPPPDEDDDAASAG